MRNPADLLALRAEADAAALRALFDALSEAPHRHDLFQALRRIEALTPRLPRLGTAARPADEPLRLAQEASLVFAPAPVSALTRPGDDATVRHPPAPRLSQCGFGFLGPNGPLPRHLTEYARERVLHHGDAAFPRLLDTLMHRFGLLFYRAWAQGRPVNNLDRPESDRFAFYIGALTGLAGPESRARDAVSDHAKLHFAGLLNMQTRPPAALAAIVAAVLRVPVAIEPFRGHWMPLARDEQTALTASPRLSGPGAGMAALGQGAVLGARVWDRQHAFRIVLGPLGAREYEALLPGGAALRELVALVRLVQNRELAWDAQLVLRAPEVPTACLGRYGRLGYSTWLAHPARRADAADLALDADAHASS